MLPRFTIHSLIFNNRIQEKYRDVGYVGYAIFFNNLINVLNDSFATICATYLFQSNPDSVNMSPNSNTKI